MPSGTVHDDGGDQLHGKGVGIVKVDSLDDDYVPEIEWYLPFANPSEGATARKYKIGQTIDFEIRSAALRGVGQIRYAVASGDAKGNEKQRKKKKARKDRKKLEP